MNKYAACACLAATCTLGCSNLARRTETESHFFGSSQAVAATSLKPALAKLTASPGIDSAIQPSAESNGVKIDRPANPPSTNGDTTSALPQNYKTTVAVAGKAGTTPKGGL